MTSKNVTPEEYEAQRALEMLQGNTITKKVIDDLIAKIDELKKPRVDPCPTCGCDELLCGFPKNCTSEVD